MAYLVENLLGLCACVRSMLVLHVWNLFLVLPAPVALCFADRRHMFPYCYRGSLLWPKMSSGSCTASNRVDPPQVALATQRWVTTILWVLPMLLD